MAAWHLISRAGIEGDYLEFGVYRGDTFRNSMVSARNCFRATTAGTYGGRFFAFDSFEGLPTVEKGTTESDVYEAGEFCASIATFRRTIGSVIRWFPVHIIEGWFDISLTDAVMKQFEMTKAAFVNIDCDLYESTIPVLNFITPIIQTGTVLYFDDWFSIKGSEAEGEAKACAEWLKRNPHLSLVHYRNVGITGKMFLVQVASKTQ